MEPKFGGVVNINQQIDDDLHRRAKIAAAQAGISLKALVERGLELRDRRGRAGAGQIEREDPQAVRPRS